MVQILVSEIKPANNYGNCCYVHWIDINMAHSLSGVSGEWKDWSLEQNHADHTCPLVLVQPI